MHRLKELILGFIVVSAAVTGLLVARFGEEAVSLGTSHRGFETVIDKHLARVPRLGLPWVMWIGDSTIRSNTELKLPGYPFVVGERLQRRLIANLSLAIPGLDSFHQYYLAGPFASEAPTVMILIANLRVLGATEIEMPRNYLCQFLNPRELGRAVTLPFHARQMTLIDVLACPILRTETMRTAARFSDGLRSLATDAPIWGEAAPPELGEVEQDRHSLNQRLEDVVRRQYTRRVRPGAPALRMLQAAVEIGVEHGSSVLVVLTPIPTEALRPRGVYDAIEFAGQTDVFREAIEASGGEFLDLHNAIPAEEFRDLSGHFNQAGIEHMADLVEPVLLRMVADARRQQ